MTAEDGNPPEGEPAIRVVAMPADTNVYGDIFGGWLVSVMDNAAGLIASRHGKGRAYRRIATLLFTVRDHRIMGHDMMQPDFIGQYALPVSSIRPGYRAVPVKNKNGEVYRGASLFCRADLAPL